MSARDRQRNSIRWMWIRKPILVNAILSLLSVALVVVAFEGVGRIWARLRPAYDVVFLQPDRALGWKQVPNLHWTWAGNYWYAAEFSVPVETNSEGFRDLERNVDRPAGVVRIALLGDSIIEAAQVPFEQTAGQVLEKRLNKGYPTQLGAGDRSEVLNFGISNYGVGQFLLTWEEYTSRYEPDAVFVLVAAFHLQRTVARFELGGFPATREKWLSVRPIFGIEDGALVREPARDYDAFVEAQRAVVAKEFGGRRMRRRSLCVLCHYVRLLWRSGVVALPALFPPVDSEVLAVNLEILKELGRQVKGASAKLVLLDVSLYFDPASGRVSRALRALAKRKGFGYVDLSGHLARAERRGFAPRWSRDPHFNALGNEVIADAMYRWLRTYPKRWHGVR